MLLSNAQLTLLLTIICSNSFASVDLELHFFKNILHVDADAVIILFIYYRWHSAGTFDTCSKTGGPFGTMRFKEELSHGANNGLDISLRLLDPIRQQFPILSHADFYQVIFFFMSVVVFEELQKSCKYIEPFVCLNASSWLELWLLKLLL